MTHLAGLAAALLMLGGLTTAAAGQRAAPPPEGPEWEGQVAALVRQLGDGKYARREAAHQALLRQGPGVLRVLDRLGPQEDVEIDTRLRKVRRVLTRHELVASWDVRVRQVTDPVNGGNLTCLSGRVHVVGPPGSRRPELRGRLIVTLFDHAPAEAGAAPLPLEQWYLPPEILVQLRKRDEDGVSYPLRLPWASCRPDVRRVCLEVRYEPAEGEMLTTRSGVLRIDHGPAKEGDGRHAGTGD